MKYLPFRAVACGLSIALTIGASQAIRNVDSASSPEALAQEALRQDTPNLPKSIRLYTEALRRDVANPYRWADLATAFQASDDLQNARICYQRALVISGEVPQIWLRVANFHFDQGEAEQAIPLAARVLKIVPNYDEVLFSYFDQLLSDPAPVFVAVGDNRRVITAYTQHLIDSGNMKAARLSWRFANSAKFADNRLTSSYIDGMLRAHLFSDAQRDWVDYLGEKCRDYPQRNLLFNSGFEMESTGSPLDWRIEPSDKFATLRDESVFRSGKWSLKVQFNGTDNVSYANVSQVAWVKPGRYRLGAWIRTENITTNEGIRLEVNDAEIAGRFALQTNPIGGTSDWRLLEETFTVPSPTVLLSVHLVRIPSLKFDNKISGTVWVDDMILSRL
jgi:hypothetical protein